MGLGELTHTAIGEGSGRGAERSGAEKGACEGGAGRMARRLQVAWHACAHGSGYGMVGEAMACCGAAGWSRSSRELRHGGTEEQRVQHGTEGTRALPRGKGEGRQEAWPWQRTE